MDLPDEVVVNYTAFAVTIAAVLPTIYALPRPHSRAQTLGEPVRNMIHPSHVPFSL